jgi:hypothetical protein
MHLIYVYLYCPHAKLQRSPFTIMSESSTWFIAPIKTPFLTWGERRGTSIHCCPYCGLHLLTGERPGFCCGKEGQYLQQIPPLPPLPPQYDIFITHPQISSLSRVLNLIFSFAALETTHEFPEIAGPPGFFRRSRSHLPSCSPKS